MIKIKILLCISFLILGCSCAKLTYIPFYEKKVETSDNTAKIDANPIFNIEFVNYPKRQFGDGARWVSEKEFTEELTSDLKSLFTNDQNARNISINMKINSYYTFHTTFSYCLCTPIDLLSILGTPLSISKVRTRIQTEIKTESAKVIYNFSTERKKFFPVGLYYHNLYEESKGRAKYKAKWGSPLNSSLLALKEDIILKSGAIENDLYSSAKDINKIKSDIEEFVNGEITKWQEQGMFESSTEYQQRVTALNRQENIESLTQIGINSIALKEIKIGILDTDYDPDNEVFKMNLRLLPSIYIKVPSENKEASSFETNRSSLIFSNADFTLTEKGFALLNLDIKNPVNGKTYRYNYQNNLTFKKQKIEINSDPSYKLTFKVEPLNISNQDQNKKDQDVTDVYKIDINLPVTKTSNPDAIGIIIGNSDYNYTDKVNYAVNDALLFQLYMVNVLGFKPGNIILTRNATKGDFEGLFGNKERYDARLNDYVKPGISDVFIYYSGHGAPGINDKKAYFIPVDCDPLRVELQGYSLELLYNNLKKIPAKSYTIVLDACFSGAGVIKNISSVRIPPRDLNVEINNGIIITSSDADEVASWYFAEQHGLFTYFFLKALHDYKNSDKNQDGNLTFQEIYNYISDNSEGIPYYARRLNKVEQHPMILGTDRNKVLVVFK